MEALGSSTIW